MAGSLLDLWARIGETVRGLSPADLARSTPDPAMDLGALGAHVTGTSGSDVLPAGPTAARDDAVRRLAGRAAGDRVLGAHCLDLWVHAHDLDAAVSVSPSGSFPGPPSVPGPFDLGRHAPVAIEACRLVADLPLRPVRAGPEDLALRLVVRDATGSGRVVLDRVLGGAATDTLEIDAGALLLLLTGRADPVALRTKGAAQWSGPGAMAFVDHARLPGALVPAGPPAPVDGPLADGEPGRRSPAGPGPEATVRSRR